MELESYKSFDDNGPVDEAARSIGKFLKVDLSFYLGGLGEPISLFDIEDQDSLTQALNCLATMQRHNVYRGQSLGMIDTRAPRSVIHGMYRQGEVVFFQDVDDDSATVERPYSQEWIDRSLAQRSLIFTSVCINVPSRIIRPVIASK